MLASGGGLSYGSPAAASDRPSRLILIWLYLYVSTHVSPTSHDSLFLFYIFYKGSHVKLTWLATYKYSQIKMRRDGRSEAAAGLP